MKFHMITLARWELMRRFMGHAATCPEALIEAHEQGHEEMTAEHYRAAVHAAWERAADEADAYGQPMPTCPVVDVLPWGEARVLHITEHSVIEVRPDRIYIRRAEPLSFDGYHTYAHLAYLACADRIWVGDDEMVITDEDRDAAIERLLDWVSDVPDRGQIERLFRIAYPEYALYLLREGTL